MKMDAWPEGQLEAWRTDPITRTYLRDLEELAAHSLSRLDGAMETGDETRVRFLGGVRAGLRRAIDLATAKGKSDE